MEKMRDYEKVSVIIPTMTGREVLLKRLLSTIPEKCEKIIIGGDGLLAAKRNEGARKAKRKYLLFIDDDNYLRPYALKYLTGLFKRVPDVGVMGMMACYDDDKEVVADGGSKRNYLTGFTKGINTNRNIHDFDALIYEVDEVANAFMMRRNLWKELGGFDEENFPIDLDEADFCKRAKDAGKKVVINPVAVCYHKSQTYSHIPNFRRPLNAYFMGRNRVNYQRKHLDALSYRLHLVVFCPVFVCFYTVSLLYRKNAGMIPHFLKGVLDGIRGRKQNKFQ